MAKSLLCSLLLLLCLLLLHAPSSCSSAASEKVKVDDICSKHKNPSFCASVLKSKAGADLQALAKHALKLAKANATKTLKQLKSLIKHTKDPDLKQHYQSCSGNYEDALGDLNNAQEAFKSGDYNGMNINAAAVMTNVDECGSQPQPHADPSIPKNTKDLSDLSVIIAILANSLAPKN